MKIYLATDHAGFDFKEKIKAYVLQQDYQLEDCGAFSLDTNDDYPDFISKAAQAVSENPENKAIIFGGSGQGEAMIANRYKNVRAAVFYGPRISQSTVDVQGNVSNDPFEVVRLCREHNDANILSIAARMVTEDEAKEAVNIFLTTEFSNDPRHIRRIRKIDT